MGEQASTFLTQTKKELTTIVWQNACALLDPDIPTDFYTRDTFSFVNETAKS